MGESVGASKIFQMSEWVIRFAYLNLLWMLFNIAGLLVFSIFPSTVAMFTVMNKWLSGDETETTFRVFWKAFRTKFFKSNLVGLIIVSFGAILYIDFKFFATIDHSISILITLLLFSLLAVYIIVLLYIFPVLAKYELSTFQYIKNAFIFGVSFPVKTLLMLVSLCVVYLIMSVAIGVIPFFAGSLLSFCLMKVADRTFKIVEEKLVKQVST